jgi:hypothetical protein
MSTPVRLRLSRQRGFDLQAHSREVNGLPAVNFATPQPLDRVLALEEYKKAHNANAA